MGNVWCRVKERVDGSVMSEHNNICVVSHTCIRVVNIPVVPAHKRIIYS